MDLGEKLYIYRTQKGLSQLELAALLAVSRQSVSKWETGASVPELDKLVRLCDVFGITLDELVKGDPTSSTDTQKLDASATDAPQVPPPNYTVEHSNDNWRKIAGLILICTGALIFIVLSLLGGVMGGLIFASPFWLCGGICMLFRKHIGLWCAWAIYFCVATYLQWATGTNTTTFIFHMIYYSLIGGMTVGTIVSMVLLAVYVVLIIVTVAVFRTRVVSLTKLKIVCSVLGAVVILLMWLAPHVVLMLLEPSSNSRLELRMLSFAGYFSSWVETVIFVLLLTTYIPHLIVWLKARKIKRLK